MVGLLARAPAHARTQLREKVAINFAVNFKKKRATLLLLTVEAIVMVIAVVSYIWQ